MRTSPSRRSGLYLAVLGCLRPRESAHRSVADLEDRKAPGDGPRGATRGRPPVVSAGVTVATCELEGAPDVRRFPGLPDRLKRTIAPRP